MTGNELHSQHFAQSSKTHTETHTHNKKSPSQHLLGEHGGTPSDIIFSLQSVPVHLWHSKATVHNTHIVTQTHKAADYVFVCRNVDPGFTFQG